jgi:TRAP-type transport system large permease protein
MIKQGYSREFTAAILAFGSIITATIPPSIGLILFGFINEVSIGRLFLAGILPGVLLTAILMATCWIVAKKNGYQADLKTIPTAREFGRGFLDSVWSLMFPVILVVGFRFGIFTATEAGVFLVAYAALVGRFIYRELTAEKLYRAFKESVTDVGTIMILILMAAVLGYAMTIERVPQQVTEFVTTLTSDPLGVLLLVVGLLVITGMFLEGAANILLVTPIVMPVLVSAGYDPVLLGIVMVTLINFGGLTPPVGVIMFTVCGVLDVKSGKYARAALPFMLAFVVFLTLLIAFPQITLVLPNALM